MAALQDATPLIVRSFHLNDAAPVLYSNGALAWSHVDTIARPQLGCKMFVQDIDVIVFVTVRQCSESYMFNLSPPEGDDAKNCRPATWHRPCSGIPQRSYLRL